MARRDNQLLRSLEKVTGAISLSDVSGKGNIDKLQSRQDRITRKLGRRGFEFDEGGSPIDVEGFNPRDFSGTDPISLGEAGRFRRILTGGGQGPQRPSRFDDDIRELNALRRIEEGQQRRSETIEPAFEQIRAELRELQAADAINAEEIAARRSEIATQVATAEGNRLGRIAGSLGLRGIDPSSPAGAALVARTAQEADTLLVDSFRRLGIEVEDVNRQDQERLLQLAAQLTLQEFSASEAAASGDFEILDRIQGEISGLSEALRQQFDLRQLQDQLIRESQQSSLQLGLQVLSTGAEVAGAVAGA